MKWKSTFGCLVNIGRQLSCDAVTKTKLEKHILLNTVISRDHMVPEISLRLITPICDLFHKPMTDSNRIFENDPFWGFFWPGGQAVCRFILDNPSFVRGKSVLDIGSGSGACSIAAKLSGAKNSTANDIDMAAGVAATINAQLNSVDIEICSENLIGKACVFEVILLGDLFYDSEIAEKLFPWIKLMKKEGKIILIGDPGRHGITENFHIELEKLVTYELPENSCIENNGFKNVYVWKVL